MELTGLDWPVEVVAERLTLSGTACEDIVPTARYMDKVIVAEVVDLQPIAGADKIRKAVLNTGAEKLDVVCGAPNVEVGQKVPLALVGARLAGEIEVRKVKIRGIESSGMICSEKELGMSDDHSGIIVLEQDAVPGRQLVEQLDFDDYILDIELTPDRADSMSAIGIARDLAALASTKLRYPAFKLPEAREKANEHIKVTIDDPEACPRFTARIIRNIKIGPSPWWLQKKLLTAGLRPISNIVDITNLVMLETGNPVHAFDLDRFGSGEVVVRRAKEGEEFSTLDGKKHTLNPEVLLITNGKEAKAAAGVMGGLDSEVSDQTKNILLEVAYFNPAVIRRSRKRMGMISEASSRFEKGVDPNNVEHASARVASLLHELCGGEVLAGIVDCYPEKTRPCTVAFRPERCNKLLGTDYKSERMAQIFHGLEFEVSDGNPMRVTVPTFRHDISGEVDLIEEIARIEGFDSIPDATVNNGPLFTPLHSEDIFEDDLRRILTSSGFDEMVGHGFADSRLSSKLNQSLAQLRVVNPLSEDLDILRNSLVHTGLHVVSHNLAHRNLNLRLFEIGRVYSPPDPSGEWREEDRLLLLVSGSTRIGWREKSRPLDFHDIVGVLNSLGEHFRWPKISFEQQSIPFFNAGVSFMLKAGPVGFGSIGKVSDEIIGNFDIKQPVYLAELVVSDLIRMSGSRVEFMPLPIYPAAPRDLAIVVRSDIRVGDILDCLTTAAGDLAETIELFDLYIGKQIEKGKKSVGVAITYRSRERSLSSEEVDSLQKKIIAVLKQKFDAEIREKH